MANAFHDGNWILDTPSNTAKLLGITTPIRVKRLEWKPGAGAETLIIQDQYNVEKVKRVSIAASPAGDEFIDYGSKPLELNGFILHTMGGGILHVYLD